MNVVEQKVTNCAAAPVAAKPDTLGRAQGIRLMPHLLKLAATQLLIKLGVVSSMVVLAAPAIAACNLQNFNAGLQSTGTGPFNAGACVAGGTAHAVGDDACSTDSVVRTNDTYIYRFNYKIPAGTAETNITFESTLPLVNGKKVVVWDGLPAQCTGPGSAVSNGGLTLLCDIGDKDQTNGGDLNAAVLAQVKATIQGADGNNVNIDVTSKTDQCSIADTGGSKPAPVVQISGRQKVDFRKDVLYQQQDAFTFNGVPGYIVAWYVYMDQFDPSGAASKGGEAIAGPVSFNDVSTNFPPNSIWFDCFDATGRGQGNISCPSRGTLVNPSAPQNITITPRPEELGEFLVAGGKNTSIERDPFTSEPQRLATFAVRYWIPLSDVQNPANQIPSGQIDLKNAITGFTGQTVSGAAVVDQVLTNNELINTIVPIVPGGYYKYIARDWVNSNWAHPSTFGGTGSGNWQLDGTNNWGDSGTALVYPGQMFFPRLDYFNRNAVATTTPSILCENFKNTQVELVEIPGSNGHAAGWYYSAPSEIANGAPGNISGAFPQGYTVQYGVSRVPFTSQAAMQTSRCEDADATWYPTLTAAAAAGQKDNLNKVRMIVPQLGAGENTLFTIAQRARPGINGTYYPDYTPYKLATVNGGNWQDSTYNVGDATGGGAGANTGLSVGKRVQITTALARIQKEATVNGSVINTATAGGTVLYTLTPSLQSIVPGLPATYVTVQDRLPAPLAYQAGSATPPPDSIQSDAGGTTLTWTLNNVTANTTLPTISFAALVPETITPNSSVVNRAVISTPDDASPESQRQTTKSLTVLNPPGIKVFKSTSTPLIETNKTATFKLQVANFESTPTTVDVIDVLPYVGDSAVVSQQPLAAQAGRNPISTFAGTIQVGPGSVAAPAGSVVRYKRGPASGVLVDPLAAGNTAAASDGWCLPAEFGTSTCPANWAAVVAFRVSNMVIAGNGIGEIGLDTPTAGNTINNRYTNRFGIRTADTQFSFLRSNDVPVIVALAKISGRVYVDRDGGATQNNTGANPEPSLPGVTVTLCLVNPATNGGVCPAGQSTTTQTDATGDYSFPNLSSGQYWIQETKPPGYANGPNNAAGTAGGSPVTNGFSAVTLPIGANASNYNFGHRQTDLTTRAQLPAGPVLPGAVVNGTVTFNNVSNVDGENTTATIKLNPNLTGVVVTPPAGWTAGPYNLTTGEVPLVKTGGVFPAGSASGPFSVQFAAPATGSVTLTSVITNSINDENPGPTPADAAKRNQDTAVVAVLPQKIDTRKRVGVPREISQAECEAAGSSTGNCSAGSTFIVPYRLVVGNNNLITATFVQAADNLATTFPAPAIIVKVQKTAPAALTGAEVAGANVLAVAPSAPVCAPSATAFNGGTQPNLLSGNFDLAPGQKCEIEFAVIVQYPTPPQVPSVAQVNTVFAYTADSSTSAPTAFAGAVPTYPANVRSKDASTDSPQSPADPASNNGQFPSAFPTPPSAANGDLADPTPVSFRPQALDVRKSSSYPVQTDLSGKKFRIFYTANATNTGTAPATNVQLSENLKFTFPTPAVFTVSNLVLATPASGVNKCVANDLNNAFDGGKAYTGSNARNYNMLGGATGSSLTLLAGEKCVVSFQVDVDYTAGTVPNTPPENRIFGSTASAQNDGPPFDPTTGAKSGDNPNMINKDTSANINPVTRPYGVAPADPGAPTDTGGLGSKGDSGSGSPARLKTLETVKATTGPAVAVGAGVYRIPYVVKVIARGTVGESLPNVQMIDNLKQAYQAVGGAPQPTITVLSHAVTAIAGGACPSNASFAAYNGDANQRFFAGNTALAVDTGCEFTYTVELNYGGAVVNTNVQANQVYASSIDGGTNPGGSVSVNPAISATTPNGVLAGTFIPPSGPGLTLVAFDGSSDGGSLPTSQAADRPLPTPIKLAPPPTINAIKYVRNVSRPDAPATQGDVLEWTVIYKNDGTTPATGVQVTDTRDAQFTSMTLLSAERVPTGIEPTIPNTAFNGAAGNTTLLASTVTLAPGEFLRFKINAVVAATAVGTLNNQANLSASELGGPTGTLVPTSAVNPTGYPNCPSTGACIPAGVIVPTDAIVSAPATPGAKGVPNAVPVVLPAGVSGRVFLEAGVPDAAFNGSDSPLQTVTIVLCRVATTPCPSSDIQATTTTNITGNYGFANVPPNNYFIQEVQPQGYGSSTPNSRPVNMVGVAIVNQDFAETAASISGTVYQDNNGSGTLNTGDTGLQGIPVKLCRSSDPTCADPVATTSTGTGGTYTFTSLRAPLSTETYFIQETQASVPTTLSNGSTTVGTLAAAPGGVATPGTANSPNSVVSGITWTPSTTPSATPSATGLNYNFGEIPSTSVSGRVILDKDFNGALSTGETGIPGNTTTITLCRTQPAHGALCPAADVVQTTTTTPGTGAYIFNNVTPGTYYVVETQPVGYASSSSNTSPPVNIVGATPAADINFYETGARLSGTVYKDTNYSGVFDATPTPADVALPGVVVRLCTTSNCAAGSLVSTATTTAAGLYQFNDLPAPPAGQQYFIVEDQSTVPPTPNVLSDGTTTVGTFAVTGTGGTTTVGTAVQSPSRIDGVSWTPPTSVVTNAPPVVGSNFNFGEIEGVDVKGKVFFDSNRNGNLDSPTDTPISGVTMTLCRVAIVPCPATSVAGTTTTDINGDYTFPRVPPGSYFVQETQPSGYGSAPTSPDLRPITVANTNVTGINFADTLSSISGLVYRDDNGSQTRDGTEATMPAGITITLAGIDSTGATVTRTAVTNASGTYVFDNLRTGTYTITESQPAGFGNGGANPGTLAGGTGGSNNNSITNIQLPANTDAPNYNFGDVPRVAGVSGTVWRDNDHDRQRDADEPVLPGWTVQVLRTPFGGGTPTLVATAISDANGAYSVPGLEAGGGYSVRFIAPGGAVFGGAVDGEQGNPISGASIARGEITNLTLTATVTGAPNIIPQQSLPVDPSGVVYDSDTRLPIPGAEVRFEGVNCPTFDPALHLVGGAANQTQTVGPDGFYQFLLNPSAPSCQYRIVVIPPAAYQADPAIPPQPGALTPPGRPPNDVFLIVPNSAAPQDGQPTTYYLDFNLNPNSRDVVNNHIPLVARARPVLFITKVANKSRAELGDTVKYTVRVRYAAGGSPLTVLKVVDSMPAGFKLIADTSFVSVPAGAPAVQLAAANIIGAPGAVVTYNIPVPGAGLPVGAEVELTYRVRVAVGSMQGDGINRAQARSTGTLRSNIAQAKVIVDPGVFTNDGCVAGKVFVDCNNNHIQDAEELGMPNVRMYMEDGTYFITDSEGKYNYCGLSPKSHVITIDMLTMPRGSRLTTTSNRNLGDANSMFLDVKNGQLIRADFAEGSCSNTVLEQVKARRTQGEVRSTDTEKKGQPALKWEGKSPQYPQQGTDGANQPLVVPRTTNGGAESAPEQNTPVPQMPGASSNTQGANVRNAK